MLELGRLRALLVAERRVVLDDAVLDQALELIVASARLSAGKARMAALPSERVP